VSWPLNETTTLRAVHSAIVAAARAWFGDAVQQYGAYEPWGAGGENPDADAEIKTPALLLELESIEPDDTDAHGPGLIAVRCAWAFHAILSQRTDDLQIALPEFAAAAIALIRRAESLPYGPPLNGNRWGLGEAVGVPEAVSARPGPFTPGLNGRDSWLITWEQVVYLPETLPTD